MTISHNRRSLGHRKSQPRAGKHSSNSGEKITLIPIQRRTLIKPLHHNLLTTQGGRLIVPKTDLYYLFAWPCQSAAGGTYKNEGLLTKSPIFFQSLQPGTSHRAP